MTTVLIVDDHEGFRVQARQLLEGAGFDVVGEAGDGASALIAAADLHPDAVLLDVQLPDTTGFDVSVALIASARPPTVVLVSSRDAADYGRRIHGCGAAGFIAKAELTGANLGALLGSDR
jgi:DNA-binding NarL/FixJ family response regulator